MSRWTDQFVGDRMAVDRAFSERVAASEFSSQEWGTIMTAVELEIENPEDTDEARVVADTGKVDQVMPALEEMRQNLPGAAGAAAGGSPGGSASGNSSGLWLSLKRLIGLGSDSEDHRTESAAALAEEYAMQFQEHLQERGKWERACRVAAESDGGDRGLEGADVEGASDAAEDSGAVDSSGEDSDAVGSSAEDSNASNESGDAGDRD